MLHPPQPEALSNYGTCAYCSHKCRMWHTGRRLLCAVCYREALGETPPRSSVVER
jgi:hypothetical protein